MPPLRNQEADVAVPLGRNSVHIARAFGTTKKCRPIVITTSRSP